MAKSEFDMKRNLIVNYLPSSLSQEDVKEMFSSIGPVSNCKLVRNNATGQSLGYAFIEYPDEDSASKAINQISGIQMQGKTIKVSYARQSSPDIKNSNVYIGGLPQWVTEEKLLSLFSPFGTVLSHKVLTNPDGTPRGAGFVRFGLSSEAAEAIGAMSGKTLPDSNGPLTVKLAIPPASKRDSIQALNSITNNNLDGLGVVTRTSNVRFNPMASSNQMFNPVMNQHSMMAGAQVLPAVNPAQRASSVYVYGLQPTHTELTLYELFSPFGAIVNVKLVRDLTKDSKPCKGYGFVNFMKNEDALRVIASMNGVPFEDKVLQVSFKQNKTQQLSLQPHQHQIQQPPQYNPVMTT